MIKHRPVEETRSVWVLEDSGMIHKKVKTYQYEEAYSYTPVLNFLWMFSAVILALSFAILSVIAWLNCTSYAWILVCIGAVSFCVLIISVNIISEKDFDASLENYDAVRNLLLEDNCYLTEDEAKNERINRLIAKMYENFVK